MIPFLMLQRSALESKTKRPLPKPIVGELVSRSSHTVDDLNRAEEIYVFQLIAWFFVLFILPAILTLLYIALNPEVFTMDIAPR